MVDSDDSESEFYDALFKFSESVLRGVETTASKETNHSSKKVTCQSHETVVLFPGSLTGKGSFGIGVANFLKIICGSILDNRLTSFFKKLTTTPKLRNRKALGDDNNYPGSKVVDITIRGDETVSIEGQSRETITIKKDSSRRIDKSRSNQLTACGIDFSYSDFTRTNSINISDSFSECTSHVETLKQDTDNSISKQSANYSENSLSENTPKNQYSQTSERSSEDETEWTTSSENHTGTEHVPPVTVIHRKEQVHVVPVPGNLREQNVSMAPAYETYRERKSDRRVTLETIQETLFPTNERRQKYSPLYSNKKNLCSSNNAPVYDYLYDYPDVPDPNYDYYHRPVHAMRLDCQTGNEDLLGEQKRHHHVKNTKPKKHNFEREEDIYNPLSELEKLLELYTSHKINEELQEDSYSDNSQTELVVDIEPEIFVELKRKSDKSKNQSTPFLPSSSLSQKFRQNLSSQWNSCDCQTSTPKKVRKKIFTKKKSHQASHGLKGDTVKKAPTYGNNNRKISTPHYNDKRLKPTDIKEKNKSPEKKKTTKLNKINKLVKNIFKM